MVKHALRLFVPIVLIASSCSLFCTILQANHPSAAKTVAPQQNAVPEQARARDEVIDEAPPPSDAAEKASREAKNRQYNRGDRDLLALDPNIETASIACGPVEPLLPTGYTPVIVLGTVVKIQAYLSENRSNIYTEYQFQVTEFLKMDGRMLPLEDGNIVIDREGGSLRLRSGRVIRYEASATGMARPLHIGERCILFLRRTPESDVLYLNRGFLLREGKAWFLGQRDGDEILVGEIPDVVRELSEEEHFIHAVRQAIANPSSPQFYSDFKVNLQDN